MIDATNLLKWINKNTFVEGGDVLIEKTPTYYLRSKIHSLIKETQKNKRSNKQNAYYHGVFKMHIYHALVDLGNDISEEDAHEFIKEHVFKLQRYVDMPDGTTRKVIGSTTNLTKKEFKDKIDLGIIWAAENLSIEIPLPNEKDFN